MAATALETAPAPPAAPASGFRPHRLTVDRYDRMVAAGIFSSKEPIFLWKGQLVEKMTKNPPHRVASNALAASLFRLVPDGWHVQVEQPVILGDDSEPEPDLTVVRGAIRDYPERNPAARDVALVIEVADSSLAVDSGEMLEAYAREAIPCYWLVNIPQKRIEVYRRPEGARYTEQRFFTAGEEVPVVLDGREIGRVAVRDVLP